MTYQKFDALPAYERAIWIDGKPAPAAPGVARWSADAPPPPIGAAIVVTMNGLGTAIVAGYFVEADWLGLLVDFLAPPEWHAKQNGAGARGHIFGAEMRLATPAEAEAAAALVACNPNADQLAALQAFADRNGRNWKGALSNAWMNGRDERERDAHHLRAVRNSFGPSWLYDRCQIKPRAKAAR
jgi:hypothetical protein